MYNTGVGNKKTCCTKCASTLPRTPNLNVEVVGTRVYTGQGEQRPVSALAHVKALSTLKFGGVGGGTVTYFTFAESWGWYDVACTKCGQISLLLQRRVGGVRCGVYEVWSKHRLLHL